MNTWLIHPCDPLIFGDGKPNTAVPGGALRSRPLPPPTALAGAVRTVIGTEHDRFGGQRERSGPAWEHFLGTLRDTPVHGPLVAVVGAQDAVVGWLFPRPADAVEEGSPHTRHMRRLRPVAWPAGAEGSTPHLLPLLPHGGLSGKPWHDPRPLWRWDTELRPWLEAATPGAPRVPEAGWGARGPVPERRTHVSLDPNTGTALPGALYSTEGRVWAEAGGRRLLALSFRTPGEAGRSALHPLGGERRLGSWRACDQPWPSCPQAVRAAIHRHKAARVVLATPAPLEALFLEGAKRPFGLEGAKVVAVANDRAEVLSGWDLAARRPRPTRRLVPAGAVFFLDLSGVSFPQGGPSPQGGLSTLDTWIDQTWLCPVSRDAQDRNDGLGLALLGAWDGAVHTL